MELIVGSNKETNARVVRRARLPPRTRISCPLTLNGPRDERKLACVQPCRRRQIDGYYAAPEYDAQKGQGRVLSHRFVFHTEHRDRRWGPTPTALSQPLGNGRDLLPRGFNTIQKCSLRRPAHRRSGRLRLLSDNGRNVPKPDSCYAAKNVVIQSHRPRVPAALAPR